MLRRLSRRPPGCRYSEPCHRHLTRESDMPSVSEVVKAAAEAAPADQPKAAEPPKPRKPAKPAAEKPKQPDPPPSGPGRYRVKHRDCDAAEFDAADRADAVEQYKAFAGIIATPHPFAIEKLS